MKTTLMITLIFLVFGGFVGSVTGQGLPDKEKLKAEMQIDSIFRTMLKAAENLEYDKLSNGVDDKYNAGFIVNGSYFQNYDSLRNNLQAQSQGILKQRISIQKQKISVMSSSFALLTAYGTATVDVSSGASFVVKFFWSLVYEKTETGWKVVQSHQSNIR